jgi:tetratricopeptide (TPR) repeat protein
MLEKYKQGELTDELMEQTEADLLRQMFRRQEDNRVREDLKRLATLADNEVIDETERTQNTRMTVVHRSNPSWTWMAAAASVALLAVASWWLFLKPQPTTTSNTMAMVETYLKTDAAPVWSTTMDNTTVEQQEAKAKDAYQNGTYAEAVALFEGLPPTKKEHFFYLGISALKQQKPDAKKAVDNLLKARTLANGWQEDATNWYLALAYLQLGQNEEARKELNNIVKIGRDNVNRSEELLKKMTERQ